MSKRKDGLWCGQATLGYSSGRRRRVTVYANTREDCERKVADLIERHGRGEVELERARPGVARCSACRTIVASDDIILGFCGACFPWGRISPGGMRYPARTPNWTSFTCTCGAERWTRSGERQCTTCRQDAVRRKAGERREERVAAARALGTHTENEWLGLLAAFGHACAYCSRTGVALEKDHVIPVSRGGSELIENITPACRRCNSRKRNRTLREFAEASA